MRLLPLTLLAAFTLLATSHGTVNAWPEWVLERGGDDMGLALKRGDGDDTRLALKRGDGDDNRLALKRGDGDDTRLALKRGDGEGRALA